MADQKVGYLFFNKADWENPFIALEELCERCDIPEALRNLLGSYRSTLITESWMSEDPLEKGSRFWFFETTLHLYELAHRINEIASNGELVFM